MYSFHPPGIAAVRDGAAATDAKHRVPWHNLLGSALFAQIIECFRGTQLPYEQMAMKYVYPPLLKQDSGDSGDSGPLGFGDGIMSRFLLPLDALPRRLDQHMPTATDATTTDSREGRASTSKAHVVSDVKPMRGTKGRNTEIS